MSIVDHRRSAREQGRHSGEDRGSILVLVLVLMVIGSLMVLPLMSYSIAVMRANEVLSEKSKDLEGVKSGLRVALVDPVSLYDTCGAGGPNQNVALAPITVNGETVTSYCNFIDFEAAQSGDELRYGLIATEVGSVIPASLIGTRYVAADPMSTTEWIGEQTPTSLTDKIWFPNLPEHGLDQRPADGSPMRAGFPTCTVYFPGTYKTPLTLDGPTFFTSGIYYFESDVIVEGGADVIVGDGSTRGCTSSQEALFYAENIPATHNISGIGATWVFGKKGRLSVTNANGQPLSLVFNRRYVPAVDLGVDPSADVSILTVNGDLDIDGTTGIDLDVPGTVFVPLSQVGVDTPVPATTKSYLPSELTSKPSEPDAPTAVAAQRFQGAAVVSWTAPSNGGSPITDYTVTATTGQTCQTSGSTSCAITGLSTSTSVKFSVVATNAVGSSSASVESASITPNSGGALAVASRPNSATATPYAGVVRIEWTPGSPVPAPVTKYTVTASPGGATCEVEVDVELAPPLMCDITGLSNLQVYTFDVVATNAAGTSPVRTSGAVAPALGLGTPPPITPPVSTPFAPPAVIDIDLPDAATAVVSIPGYVSVPQGRVRINNPNQTNPSAAGVDIIGGVLAGQFDVVDGRDTGPETVGIGFEVAVVQRKFRITSTSPGIGSAVAIVQVNQNGAYAINSWIVQ
jgi:hypothetical protein